MLGIGVDEGVHIVHEFLEQSGPYKMSQSTAVAVLVDSTDDDRGLWLVDDRQPSRAAKPGPRVDDGRDLLHVHVDDHAAGAVDVDVA